MMEPIVIDYPALTVAIMMVVVVICIALVVRRDNE